MKKYIISNIIIIVIWSSLNAKDCNPNPFNRKYQYYVNLKLDSIPDNFSKTDLIKFLSNDQHNSVLVEYLDSVVKSFVGANLSNLLKKSVTIYSSNKNLDTIFSAYNSKLNFYEMICFTDSMLIFEPNDYQLITDGNKHLDLIKAPSAWDVQRGDKRIRLGLTDTYLNTLHQDINGNIGTIMQNNYSASFHGTAVAGCLSALTNNNIGISSISGNSLLVFSNNWASSAEVLAMAQLTPKPRVINMSWLNHCSFSITENAVYDHIYNTLGVVLVSGAGNKPSNNHCSSDLKVPVYPCAYPSVICVTSIGHLNERNNNTSTFGWKDCHDAVQGTISETHHHYPEVDICAPGYGVQTTNFAPNDLKSLYVAAFGTSFSSPLVASTCGLVASLNPCLTATEIRDIVVNSADATIYNYSCNSTYIGLLGTGRLDVNAAIQRALKVSTTYIQNKTYSTPTTIDNKIKILAGSNVTTSMSFGQVKTNNRLVFIAKNIVELSGGFEVGINSSFEIKLNDVSPCY